MDIHYTIKNYQEKKRWATLSFIRQNFIQQLQKIFSKKKGVLSELLESIHRKPVQLQPLLSELEILNRNDGDDEILDKVKKLFVDLFETLEKNDFLKNRHFCETDRVAFTFTSPDFVSFFTSGILPPSSGILSQDPFTYYCINRHLRIGNQGDQFMDGKTMVPRILKLFQSYKVLEEVVEKEESKKTGKETKVKYMKLDIIGIVLALLQNGVPNDTIWKNLSPFDYNLPGIELQQEEEKRLQSDKVKVIQNYNRFGKEYEQTMDEQEKERLLKRFEAYMVSKKEEQQLLPKYFIYPNFLKQVQKQRIKLRESMPRLLSKKIPSQQRTTLSNSYKATGKQQGGMLGEFISHGGTMQRSIKNDFMRFSEIITRNMLMNSRIHTVDFSFWEKEVSGKTMGYVGDITVVVVKETSESKDKYKYKLMSVTKNRDSKRYEKQATKPNLVWMVRLFEEGNNVGHMNALIYQKRTRQFYYIEPHGTETGSMHLPDEKFTPFWEDFAKSNTFPREADKSKLPNFVLGKDKGLQPKVQEKQIRPGEKVIRQGFCVTVSLFVVKLFELNHTRIETIDDFQKMMEIFMAISTLTGTLPGIVQAFNVRIMRTFLTLVNVESLPSFSRRRIKYEPDQQKQLKRRLDQQQQLQQRLDQQKQLKRRLDQQQQLQQRLDNCLKPNWMSLFMDLDEKKKKRIKHVIRSILPTLKNFSVTDNLKRLDDKLREEGISIINISRRKCLSDLFERYKI